MKVTIMVWMLCTWLSIKLKQIQAYSSHIVRVHSNGLLPYDELLPYPVLQHVFALQQAEQQRRAARKLPSPYYANHYGKPQAISTILRATIRNRSPTTLQQQRQINTIAPWQTYKPWQPWQQKQRKKQSLQFVRSAKNPKQYQLYDDDGELLINFNFHNDANAEQQWLYEKKFAKNLHAKNDYVNGDSESVSDGDADGDGDGESVRYNGIDSDMMRLNLAKPSNIDTMNVRQVKHIWLQI